MKTSPISGLAGLTVSSFLGCLLVLSLSVASLAHASLLTPVPQPKLDLSSLGEVVLTGDFDAVSLYQYEQQKTNLLSTHSSPPGLSILLPNGFLNSVGSTDGIVKAMCLLKGKVMIGGSFSTIGGTKSNGIASFDPSTDDFSSIPGLSGNVSSLVCDDDKSLVYVGGSFRYKNSTNAVTWSPDNGFSSLPFEGFDGPVNAIAMTSSGSIVFAGSFGSVRNSTSNNKTDEQTINLSSASISAGPNSDNTGYSDPKTIACPQKTWLLADNAAGYWRADTKFEFQPTRLRLYNSKTKDRGTKLFSLTAFPGGGIMNLTYTDSRSHQNSSCDPLCPLPSGDEEPFRDFHFVNPIGMSGFQIDIKEWYGAGGGLDGIELFQHDIVAYAINKFNEPSCTDIPFPSDATTKGSWSEKSPLGRTPTDYLWASVNTNGGNLPSVVFKPDVKVSGKYAVTVYTPGCNEDNSCANRGQVEMKGVFTSDQEDPISFSTFQTNDFEKYDQIYVGHVDANGENFRTHVSVAPTAKQGTIDVVASRVQFYPLFPIQNSMNDTSDSSSGDNVLNGLFEYDPSQHVISNISSSSINNAGMSLGQNACISALVSSDKTLYVAGNFSHSKSSNILSIADGKATGLKDNGLNSNLKSLLVLDNVLYAGGSFTSTSSGDDAPLNHVAAYSLSSESWSPLGSGVDGTVTWLAEFPVNITTNKQESALAVSGNFTHIMPTSKKGAVKVPGFAIWVPSKKDWLSNLNITQEAYYGQLTASVIDNSTTIVAGDLVSGGMFSPGAVSISNVHGKPNLAPLPFQVDQTDLQTKLNKRGQDGQSNPGILTSAFYTSSGRNLSIFGGHFSANSSDGTTVKNLVILDGNNGVISGIGASFSDNATFLSLATSGNALYAGGVFAGNVSGYPVSGLITYDLQHSRLNSTQPPALQGAAVKVNAVAPQPSSTNVYVGGEFDAAASLPCPNVCVYDTIGGGWNRPGSGIEGTAHHLQWMSKTKLLAAGNFTVNSDLTYVAIYDSHAQTWSAINDSSTKNIPAPITSVAFEQTDGSRFWISGKKNGGDTFLMFYDGKKFHTVDGAFDAKSTEIRSIQVVGLDKNHHSSDFLQNDQVLLVSGSIKVPNFGDVAAALYNGTTLAPFLLATTANRRPGSIKGMFTSKLNTYQGNTHHGYSTGIIVLVSFCISLGCVFGMVLGGIIASRIQRYRQGYVVAPQGTDRKPDLNRVPPEYLLNSLRARNPGAPTI